MVDFILGALLVLLLLRGWFRGFVREVIGLAVLLVGTLLAFKLSEPAGALIGAMAGTSHDISRYAGGIAVFLLVAIGGAIVSFVAHKGVRSVPGLPTMNRAGGAFFALGAGLLVATVAASAFALLPAAAPVTRQLERSTIGRVLVDPDGPAQAALGVVAGDRVVSTMLTLRGVVGDRRLVAGDSDDLALPAVERTELRQAPKAADKLSRLINESRVAADAAPLARSTSLDEIAATVAFTTYNYGRLDGMKTAKRLAAAGIPALRTGEVVAIGVSPGSIHQGILESEDAHRKATRRGFNRMGVAVVKGPYGMLAAVVFAG